MTRTERRVASVALATTTAAALTITIAAASGGAAPIREDHRQVATAKPAPGARALPFHVRTGPAAPQARASRSMLAGTPAVPLDACDDDPAWLCGAIEVPFDRARPGGRQQPIAFAVLPHADPAATAADALVMTDGGPGIANIANKGFLQYLAGDLAQERDVVVVDHRGTGQSDVIDCPAVQDPGDAGTRKIIRDIGRCGRQLGDAADRYGSGDVAQDLDAVRRALGYGQISMYGNSYGGVFVSAYATRYPHRLRAAVIDSGSPTTDPRHSWTWGQDVPRATAAGAALDCARAPACAAAQPRSGSALARIAAAVRRQPQRGMVTIAGDGRQRVVVDQRALISLAAADWRNVAELAAVADALDHGDPLPLLRLAGEDQRFPFEPADPELDSWTNNAAVYCNDVDPVWDREDPVRVRRATYRAALESLSRRHAFAPYGGGEWTDYFLSALCTYWPTPDRFTPAIPPGTTVTQVPTLIISGDRDVTVPTRTVRENLRVFPDARLVPVAGAAHAAAGWSECGGEVFHDFVRTLDLPPATACTDPAWVMPAASTYPRRARAAVPADAGPGDTSTPLQRKVVTAAVQTVRDAWMRSFKDSADVGPFAGLRGGGGTFDYSGWPTIVIELESSRYVADVAVTGESTYDVDTNTVTFAVEVDGPDALDGSVTGEGGFGFGPPFADFQVSGSLDGDAVTVTVPAN